MPKTTEANDKAVINFIVDTLLSGTIKYNDVMELTCAKFGTSTAFFSSRWKQAQTIFNDRMSELEAKRSEMLEPELYNQVLTKIELCVILSEQIKSDASLSDKNKAIDLLSKLMAYYAPTKLDHVSDGKAFTNKVIIYDNGRGEIDFED